MKLIINTNDGNENEVIINDISAIKVDKDQVIIIKINNLDIYNYVMKNKRILTDIFQPAKCVIYKENDIIINVVDKSEIELNDKMDDLLDKAGEKLDNVIRC